MANQPRLGSIVRVYIGSRESQRRVPCVRCARILGPQSQDLRLSSLASRLRSRIRVAHVGQLVADTVRDDVRVQRLLLALIDQWVLRLKREFSVRAPVEPGLEFDGRCAETEVQSGDGGFDEAWSHSGRSVWSSSDGSRC